MNFKTITLATAAAFSLLIAAPDTQAQERGDQNPPNTDRPKTDRPQDVEKIDKDKVNGTRPITAGDKDKGKGPDADKKAKLKLVQTAMREEKKHREILAKITRLRDVFTANGNDAQLKKLEGAEEREDARYKKLVTAAKTQMGDETFAEVAAMLEKGKARAGNKIKGDKDGEKGRTTDRKRGDKDADEGRTTDRKRGDKDAEKGRTTDRKREDKGGDKGRTTDRKREGENKKREGETKKREGDRKNG